MESSARSDDAPARNPSTFLRQALGAPLSASAPSQQQHQRAAAPSSSLPSPTPSTAAPPPAPPPRPAARPSKAQRSLVRSHSLTNVLAVEDTAPLSTKSVGAEKLTSGELAHIASVLTAAQDGGSRDVGERAHIASVHRVLVKEQWQRDRDASACGDQTFRSTATGNPFATATPQQPLRRANSASELLPRKEGKGLAQSMRAARERRPSGGLLTSLQRSASVREEKPTRERRPSGSLLASLQRSASVREEKTLPPKIRERRPSGGLLRLDKLTPQKRQSKVRQRRQSISDLFGSAVKTARAAVGLGEDSHEEKPVPQHVVTQHTASVGRSSEEETRPSSLSPRGGSPRANPPGDVRRKSAARAHAKLVSMTPSVLPPTGVDPYSNKNPSLKAYNLNRREGDPMPYAFSAGRGRIPTRRRGSNLEDAADEQLTLLIHDLRYSSKAQRSSFFRRLAYGVDVAPERILKKRAPTRAGRRPFAGGKVGGGGDALLHRMHSSPLSSPKSAGGGSARGKDMWADVTTSGGLGSPHSASGSSRPASMNFLPRRNSSSGGRSGSFVLPGGRVNTEIDNSLLRAASGILARVASDIVAQHAEAADGATKEKQSRAERNASEATRRNRVALLGTLANDDGDAVERELLGRESDSDLSDLSDIEVDGLVEGAGEAFAVLTPLATRRPRIVVSPDLAGKEGGGVDLLNYLQLPGNRDSVPHTVGLTTLVATEEHALPDRLRHNERHANLVQSDSPNVNLERQELGRSIRQLSASSLIKVDHAQALHAMLARGDIERVRSDVLSICTEMLIHDRVRYVEKDDMAVLVHVVSAAERRLRLLRSIFNAIDDDGNGDLSLEELEQNAKKMMVAAGAAVPAFGAKALFAMWDTDNSGSLDFAEFVAGMSYLNFADDCDRVVLSPHLEMWTIKQRRAARRKVFATMDEHGLGKLSIEVFDKHQHALKALGVNLPHDAVKAIFSHWDLTGDGQINFAEFETGLQMIETFTKNAVARAALRKAHGTSQSAVRITAAMMDQLLDERQHNVAIVGWLKKLPIFRPVDESAKAKTARGKARKRRASSLSAAAAIEGDEAPARRPGLQRWAKRYFVLADDGGGGMFAYFRRDGSGAQLFAGIGSVDVEAGIAIHDAKRGRNTNILTAAERAKIQTTSHAMPNFKTTGQAVPAESFGKRMRRMSSTGASAAAQALNVELPQRLNARDIAAGPQGVMPITFRTLVTFGPKDAAEIDLVDADKNVLTIKATSEADAARWHRALRAVTGKDMARQALLREAVSSSAWGPFVHRPDLVRDWTTLIRSVRSPKREGITEDALDVIPRAKLVGNRDAVFAMDWSRDGRYLVSGGKASELVVHSLVDLGTSVKEGGKATKDGSVPELPPNHRLVLERGWTSTVRFSPDMRLIASGGLDQTVSVTAWLFGADDREEIGAHRGLVHSIQWAPDNQGKQILSASGDTTCALWDVEELALVTVFDAHSSDVLTLATKNGDGNLFLSGSSDCMTRSWDIRRCEKEIFTRALTRAHKHTEAHT